MKKPIFLSTLIFSSLGTILLATTGAVGLSELQKEKDPKTKEEPFSLKVNVDLVVLNLTVMDENGANITSLKQEDFSIYEDEVKQEISTFLPVESPFNLVLVLDTSISTRTSLPLIKKAASNFTDQLRPTDRIAIAEINFLVRQAQDFTSDRKILKKAIQRLMTYSSGGSKIYDGIAEAVRQLQKTGVGRKAVIILSDGMENSSRIKFEELRRLLAQADAVLYPITILNKESQKDQLEDFIKKADRKKPDLAPIIANAKASLSVLEEVYQVQTERLQSMAEETGGKTFLVANLADLAGEYAKVAQELRNTFSLAYYSKNKERDGTMRKIRVEVKNPTYHVRTRTGYFVPQDQ
jgi:Ca-activated chloride channel homolog